MATRNSSTLTLTLPSDREIVMARLFEAPRSLVFDAFTKPEHLVRWFGQPPERSERGRLSGWTMPVCEVDLSRVAPGVTFCEDRTAPRWA